MCALASILHQNIEILFSTRCIIGRHSATRTSSGIRNLRYAKVVMATSLVDHAHVYCNSTESETVTLYNNWIQRKTMQDGDYACNARTLICRINLSGMIPVCTFIRFCLQNSVCQRGYCFSTVNSTTGLIQVSAGGNAQCRYSCMLTQHFPVL